MYEDKAVIIPGATGIVIETVTGKRLTPRGQVKLADTPDGLIYYCEGASWPIKIVVKLLLDNE